MGGRASEVGLPMGGAVMTVITIPPVVAAECADRLSRLAAELSRDAATLIRMATTLVITEKYGRPFGKLKTYARENKQYGAAEVEKVIVLMEAFMDPEHVKHLARLQKKRDKDRAEFKKRCSQAEARPPTYWEPAVAPEPAKPRHNGNVIDGPWAS